MDYHHQAQHILSVDYHQAQHILTPLGQSHVLIYWNTLDPSQQNHLLFQIQSLDLPTLQEQQRLLQTPLPVPQHLEPFKAFTQAGNNADQQLGRKMLTQGQAGCLIVAGGQGTRLRQDAPKGCAK